MKISPMYKGGLLLILAGIIIKITVLILDIPNYLYAGMGFTAIGLIMIGYTIFKERKITKSKL